MLQGVLFDLDRTLLDRDASVQSFAASQYARFRHRFDSISRENFVETFVRLDARGSVWKDEVYQRLTAELGIQAVTWQELFADFDERIARHYIRFPQLHETLTDLASRYQLGLITNGRTAFQNRTIEALGIAPFLSIILISEAEGLRKPDPAIFHRALSRLNLTPAEAVYIGDHPLTDIQAARDAGLHALWKRNPDFPAAPACSAAFDHLSELPALLWQLFEMPGTIQ